MGRSVRSGERAKLFWVVYCVALFLLALNDHCLKGRAGVPPLITGKLSDFCGLIVAPLTLVLLLRARSLPLRLVCFAIPSAALVAVKLSEACARDLEALARMTGMSWRIWSDPSDLIALVVLPLGWWLTEPTSQPVKRWRFAEHLLTAAGAVACLASTSDPDHHAKAYLVNLLPGPVDVEIARLKGQASCDAGWTFPDNLLRHGDFVADEHFRIEPKGVLPLEDCGPVRVSVNRVTMGVAWDPNLPLRQLANSLDDEHKDRGQLVLLEKQFGVESLRFGPGTRRVLLSDDAEPLPVSDCVQANLPRLEFSNSGRVGKVRLETKRAIGSGCLLLEFADPDSALEPGAGGAGGEAGAGGASGAAAEAGASGEAGAGGSGGALGEPPPAVFDPFSVTWCLPESEFPFVEGELLELQNNRLSNEARTVTIELNQEVLEPGQLIRVNATSPDPACGLVRDACGAIWQPLLATAGDQPLVPGERIASWTDREISWFVVRALRPVLTRPECDAALQTNKPYVEYILWRETAR